MAKKSSEKESGTQRKNNKPERNKIELKEETRHSIWGILFFVFALFIVLSFFKSAGPAGTFFYGVFNSFFGIGYFLLPVLLVVLGISYMRSGKPQVARLHTIAGVVTLLSALAIMDIAQNGSAESTNVFLGGYLGSIASWPFVKLFGTYASLLFLGALLIISIIVMFDEKPNLITFFENVKNFFSQKLNFSRFKKSENIDGIEEEIVEVYEEEEILPIAQTEERIVKSKISQEEEEEWKPAKSKRPISAYVPPPLTLLERDKGKPNVGDIKANMNIIQRTLLNFGIQVEMDEVTIGPTVTRYALKPAQGMKLSRILGLQNDLALALAAHPIRIEAPIPGKSLVGIEIPNKVKSTVGLATLLDDDKFKNAGKPLTVALGKGLSGKAYFGNLAKMPHALIAGTTGSGKSVTIHSIITSLLYRNGPEEMRFIMVDPKRVELTLYNKIPHLLTPVITDAKKCILALKWAAKEMDRRYDVLESHSVKDITSYHENVLSKMKKGDDDEAIDKMPYIVIVIDELADIMMAYPRELEGAIVRLAQMSRAVGIHLLLSTQRPSVNVITGLIKANVPTRVALQVASQIDSRTILDAAGAEKLLGAGDMLYSGSEMSQPERLQSAFISEEEVKKVVQYLRTAYQDELPDEIELSGSLEQGNGNLFGADLGGDEDDNLYEDARQTVIETGKASTSFLQRKLGVGYARAARLIDMLEERGVVGPGNGAKPRDVLEKGMDNTQQM